MDTLIQITQDYFKHPAVRVTVIALVSLFLAMLVRFVVIRFAKLIVDKTETDLDDQMVNALKSPIFVSVFLVGMGFAVREMSLGEHTLYIVNGLIKTVAVIVWGLAAMRIGTILLELLSRLSDRFTIIQPSTLPLFQILVKVAVVGGIAYFAFISWEIDVTGWLASAGIVGIAIGFAAKDTLANLFAGIFIVTDAPYKLGDFIILDNKLRGRVTQIGIRSTRILTRDDIEVTVPNASIASSQIINETSGPSDKRRIRIPVSIAYGSDIEKSKQIMLDSVKGVDNICDNPPPQVRFILFGASGLEFQLRVWIEEPVFKGRVTDKLNTRLYKALNEAGIEIPYTKQDVYVKEFPKPDSPE